MYANVLHHVAVIAISDNLELVWVVLVKKRHRHAHNTVMVARNCVAERHLDRIEIDIPVVLLLAVELLVFAEAQVVGGCHEGQLLVTASVVQICVPPDALHADVLGAILINAASCRVQRIVIWYPKLPVAAVDGDTKPHSVCFDQREKFEVSDCLQVTYD